MLASVIFMVLAGIVFQMFQSGTKAGAKATWRTHVTGKARAAMRQVRAMAGASSYPTVVSLTNYVETPDGYEFQLQGNGVAGAGGAVFTYDAPGEIVEFYRCIPLDQTPLADTASGSNGQVERYRLRLVDSPKYPGRRRELVLEQSITTATGSTGTPPEVQIDAWGAATSQTLCTEVESFVVEVPPGGLGNANVVVTFRLNLQDPIDGNMRVEEVGRTNINTQILGTAA